MSCAKSLADRGVRARGGDREPAHLGAPPYRPMDALGVGVAVVAAKTHVKHVLAKLEARDRTQAVVWAYRTGFAYRAGS